MFLTPGFDIVPCFLKGEALETYNDEAVLPCPASFARGLEKVRGFPAKRFKGHRHQATVMECGQRAASPVVFVTRVDVCAHRP